jgi:multidrug efflux pump subunit AcrA (membrane-fusion protein)
MKQIIINCLIIITVTAFFSFHKKSSTLIVGTVSPAGSATVAWAVSGRDSSVSSIVNGTFSFEARAGIYKVVIDGTAPYKDAVLENIGVREGQRVDVGEIVLEP